MSKEKIRTLLTAMGACIGMLEKETAGDDLWEAISERFITDLRFAGGALESLYRADLDTQEFEPVVIVENGVDTQELQAVVVYDEKGRMVG